MTAGPEQLPPLVWVDMEMSGLDPAAAVILEIAVLITDADLNVLAEGPELVIHQPAAVLDAMDQWNREHHGASGLSDRVRASTTTLAQAEATILGFLGAHGASGAPLCGNSVHVDRAFIARYMPAFAARLHYRNVDVSTLKELVRRWYPAVPIPTKREAHRALSDIHESLAELRYYRARVFAAVTGDESGEPAPP